MMTVTQTDKDRQIETDQDRQIETDQDWEVNWAGTFSYNAKKK